MADDLFKQVRKIPFINPIKDEIEKINYIVEMWATPCTIPLTIQIRTLWPATMQLFWSLTEFTPLDIMAQGSGIARRRFLKKLFKGFSRVEPIENAVKDTFLWKLFDVAEISLFYFFVAEMVTDFAFQWTSLMHAQAGCSTDLGTFQASADTLVANINGEWQDTGFGTVTRNTGNWPVAGGAVIVPPGIYSIAYTGNFEWLLGPKGPFQMRAQVSDIKYTYTTAYDTNGKSFIGAVANLGIAQVKTYNPAGAYIEIQMHRDDDNPVITDGLLHNYSLTIARLA